MKPRNSDVLATAFLPQFILPLPHRDRSQRRQIDPTHLGKELHMLSDYKIALFHGRILSVAS
jgi:hypothetical protein